LLNAKRRGFRFKDRELYSSTRFEPPAASARTVNLHNAKNWAVLLRCEPKSWTKQVQTFQNFMIQHGYVILPSWMTLQHMSIPIKQLAAWGGNTLSEVNELFQFISAL